VAVRWKVRSGEKWESEKVRGLLRCRMGEINKIIHSLSAAGRVRQRAAGGHTRTIVFCIEFSENLRDGLTNTVYGRDG